MSIVIQRGQRRDPARAGACSDGPLDAIAKLLPGEVMVAFTAAIHVDGIQSSCAASLTLLLVLTALTPAFLYVSARRSGHPASWIQYAIRALAFLTWGLALLTWVPPAGHGPLVEMRYVPAWIPAFGALLIPLLAAFVLSPPGIDRPPPRPREPNR